VAAGPLASPKLLLQSDSNAFPSGLGNSHGLLGRFLHDHPNDWNELELHRPLPRLDQPLYLSRAPYSQSPPLSAASLSLCPLSKWDRVLSLAGVTSSRFGVVLFATMLPEADNYVRLHPEKRDRFGMPVLDIHIRFKDDVAQTVSNAYERLGNILDLAGFGFRLQHPFNPLVPGRAAHYAGAVRMHTSPEYGVLNTWSRLHDANNVAVVDASSFTTAVEKNPTLTVMALAARAADRLAHDLKHDALGAGRRRTHAVSSLR